MGVKMIPYKNVSSIEEVKEYYPFWYYEGIENKPKVKEFIQKELANLKEHKARGIKEILGPEAFINFFGAWTTT